MKKLILAISLAMTLSACGGAGKILPWKKNKAAPTVVAQNTISNEIKSVGDTANLALADLKKDKQAATTIAYFDADGNLKETAQSGGFYRQLLGKNQAGLSVVQDFYQDSQTPQTNPIVVRAGQDVKNFDSAIAEGRVVWYSPSGKITEFLDYHNGLVQRGAYYDENGALMLETEGDNSQDVNAPVKMRGFYASGKLLFENSQNKDESESIFYYENGQKMWHGMSSSEAIHAWTKEGKLADLTDIADEVSKAEKRANELMKKYLK